ncbi:unnamed protein product [Moneuplotes crassus]|uniref:Uncharacterized protein n=1 Tax=Euplotes crassus TaxID=5936 RepID=A0AAD1UET8_EUPCR|nr:unnamed protein product [Moneuplotes crassus]
MCKQIYKNTEDRICKEIDLFKTVHKGHIPASGIITVSMQESIQKKAWKYLLDTDLTKIKPQDIKKRSSILGKLDTYKKEEDMNKIEAESPDSVDSHPLNIFSSRKSSSKHVSKKKIPKLKSLISQKKQRKRGIYITKIETTPNSPCNKKNKLPKNSGVSIRQNLSFFEPPEKIVSKKRGRNSTLSSSFDAQSSLAPLPDKTFYKIRKSLRSVVDNCDKSLKFRSSGIPEANNSMELEKIRRTNYNYTCKTLERLNHHNSKNLKRNYDWAMLSRDEQKYTENKVTNEYKHSMIDPTRAAAIFERTQSLYRMMMQCQLRKKAGYDQIEKDSC